MKKKLVAVGNSAALIIDKAIMRLIGIGPKTVLRVTTDGYRLILEPVTETPLPAGPSRPAGRRPAAELAQDAFGVFQELRNQWGMNDATFGVLGRLAPGKGSYRGWLMHGGAHIATEEELELMERLELCLQLRKAGNTWEQTIADALRALPLLAAAPDGPGEPQAGRTDLITVTISSSDSTRLPRLASPSTAATSSGVGS